MTATRSDVLIVGASIAGLATAEALRERAPALSITVIGDEPHVPYRRPALSKQVLSGWWSADAGALTSRAALEQRGIRLITGARASAFDAGSRTVVAGVDEHRADRVVIATGAAPRRPDGVPAARTFRTLDDALGLRSAVREGSRVAVIGGGVLAAELASACRGRGARVALVTRSGLRLGTTRDLLAGPLRSLLAGQGIAVHDGAVLAAAALAGGSTALDVSDGAHVVADVVIGAIGCDPATGWLHGSGFEIRDGVVCDADGRAAEGVFAVGDVARWGARDDPSARRVEHQTSAIEQAHAVAATLTGGDPTPPGLPFFWSELGGTRVQALGDFPEGAVLRMLHPGTDRFVAVAEDARGRVHGLIGWNAPREFRSARSLLTDARIPTSPTLAQE